jgi:hypothetical protein
MLPILPIVPPIAAPITIIPAATGGLVGPQGSVGPAGTQGRIVHPLRDLLDDTTLLQSTCTHNDFFPYRSRGSCRCSRCRWCDRCDGSCR